MLLISSENAKKIPLPLDPFVFWETWGDDEWDGVVPLVGYEFNSGTHPRKVWNSLGREKLQVTRCEHFASQLSKALLKAGCKSALAGHYELSRAWVPPRTIRQRIDPAFEKLRERAHNYMRHILPKRYRGAMLLETPQEISSFFVAMLPYPTVFSYLSLYVFCTDLPVVIEIGHHANIIIYAKSQQNLGPFKKLLDKTLETAKGAVSGQTDKQ